MKTARTCDELKARLDELSGKAAAKKAAVSADAKKRAEAYNAAFWDAMHTGMPQNILKEGSDGSGGYLVPATYDDRLVTALTEQNVLRAISRTIQTEHNLHLPVAYGINGAAWALEGEPYSFADAEFGEVVIDAYKLAASVLVSDEMLEDNGVALEAYLTEAFSETLGDAEEEAFIRGNGRGKPLGLIHQVTTTHETAHVGKIDFDDLIDVMYSLKAPYRENAVWLLSEDAYRTLRQTEYHDGEALWSEGLQEGEPELLLGHPVYACKHLDNIVPGGIPVLFGDFGYFWIGERGKRTVKRLSERFAERGLVAFIASERVDAKLVIPEAVTALKIKNNNE